MELGFPHRGGRCRPEGSPFASPVCLIFRCMEWPLDRGWDPIVPGWSWLYNIRISANLEIGRSAALGIYTLCGEVSILVIYPSSFPGCRSCIHVNGLWFWEWTLSSPDNGYFMYDLRPMSDQQSDKKAIPGTLCFYFCLNSIEPEILIHQILWKKYFEDVSREVRTINTNIPSTRRENGLQQQVATILL